ncbi:N-alpha-acetyltransferase 25, NatB auxiliary subunit isoform X1 [Schistocerca gregaria]|uniref:N-alpha-acetyltransferase 25, NatB auxiliary subunit isoform X1 n=2 Tax=Schistocerca gregaria TaxID=7010 RepID=UPI00211DCB10|nr:N-alpha-acetyltransferase 25, NatB auxiliary subunit isoform X1 [Schistocerca gregaria]
MAAKTHVDSSVGERRLRPIYDWLDIGNSKKALQEADKVLKKQPNFQCAKVLKALALLRMGKKEECIELLEAVRAEVPCDDSTLQAMTICYREIHRPERICEIYEAATKKDPTNEELLTHLFMAYVRVADYKRQHQTALMLYKLKPKNPYYFWAVMSVVMQAYKADDKLSKSIVLPLAERMVEKFVNEDKIEAEQEVQLYLMILEMQGKYSEALDVVTGPLGEKLVSYVHVPYKKATLLMKLKRWRQANLLFKLMLKEDMDRWSYITEYLSSALKLIDSGQADPSEGIPGADSTPEAVRDFLARLVRDNETKLPRRLRGPYLARLEMYRLMAERGDHPEALLGDIVDLMMAYFRNFSDKPCCVSDLKRFVSLLPEDRHQEFVSQVEQTVGLQGREMPATVRQMQQHISSIQLVRTMGLHSQLTDSERLELVTHLLRCYEHGKCFNAGSLQTEFGSNDSYALLAAHVLYEAWTVTNDSSHLREALDLLECVLASSPSNFHVKLLLVKLYNMLGAGAAAQQIYDLLDIKHMQLDSLGYLHCSHLYTAGQLTAASTLYENTLKFFSGNYKDSVDHLTFSYKFGSFLKIEEFVEFRERLNNSIHYAIMSVEQKLLELMSCRSHAQTSVFVTAMEINPAKDKIDWNSLQDNRDLTVMLSWEPVSRQMSPEIVQQTFADEKAFLKFRSLILRCLGAAFSTVPQSADVCCQGHHGNSHHKSNSQKAHVNNNNNIGGSNSNNNADIMNGELDCDSRTLLSSLTDELMELQAELEHRSSVKTLMDVVSAPLPSRLHGYLSCPLYIQLLVEMLRLVSSVSRGDDASGQATVFLCGKAAGLAEAAAMRVSSRIRSEESLSAMEQLGNRHSLLETAVITIESISLAVLLCGVCHSHLKPLVTPVPKKGKKKKDATVNQQAQAPPVPTRQLIAFGQLVRLLGEATDELSGALEYWRTQQLAPELDSVVTISEETKQHKNVVNTRISDSHRGSLSELLHVLDIKRKYLASFSIGTV